MCVSMFVWLRTAKRCFLFSRFAICGRFVQTFQSTLDWNFSEIQMHQLQKMAITSKFHKLRVWIQQNIKLHTPTNRSNHNEMRKHTTMQLLNILTRHHSQSIHIFNSRRSKHCEIWNSIINLTLGHGMSEEMAANPNVFWTNSLHLGCARCNPNATLLKAEKIMKTKNCNEFTKRPKNHGGNHQNNPENPTI